MYKKLAWSKRRTVIVAFLLPAIILFGIIYAYPLVNIIYTSFCEWNYKNFVSPKFLGWSNMLDNYIKLFTVDANFQKALVNSLKWVVLTLVIQVPWSLLVALILAKKNTGWKIVRNVFVIPNILSTAAIGLIFLNLYSPAIGIVTEICNKICPGSNVSVLANENLAFWGITFSFILFGGSSCLLIMTQIFSIDAAVLEAAKVDGATNLQIDTQIIIPILKPMIGTVSVMAANYGLLLYNEIALITGGGPDNATYSLSYYIYKTALGSQKLNFARGNAAGVIQMLIGIVLVGTINYVFQQEKKERKR
ncbi:MAG: carbohydrate ABC transporter permease [Suilimivivens sp.]